MSRDHVRMLVAEPLNPAEERNEDGISKDSKVDGILRKDILDIE